MGSDDDNFIASLRNVSNDVAERTSPSIQKKLIIVKIPFVRDKIDLSGIIMSQKRIEGATIIHWLDEIFQRASP